MNAEQHAGRMRGLGKYAMHVVAEDQFEAKGDAAGRAPNAAWQIDEQGMMGIDDETQVVELLAQALCSHGITEKQRGGVFVIDKVTARIGCSLLAPLRHGL